LLDDFVLTKDNLADSLADKAEAPAYGLDLGDEIG
jgi:hypothetical protein